MTAEEIINYTKVADQCIIKIFSQLITALPEAERLFSHVLNAQHIWAKRILGIEPLYGVWQIHPRADFKKISEDNFKLIDEALKENNLDQVIHYQNSRGTQFENQVAEILFHLFNHSTYHRSQVVTLLKKAGFEPPVTDYIILKRDHLL